MFYKSDLKNTKIVFTETMKAALEEAGIPEKDAARDMRIKLKEGPLGSNGNFKADGKVRRPEHVLVDLKSGSTPLAGAVPDAAVASFQEEKGGKLWPVEECDSEFGFASYVTGVLMLRDDGALFLHTSELEPNFRAAPTEDMKLIRLRDEVAELVTDTLDLAGGLQLPDVLPLYGQFEVSSSLHLMDVVAHTDPKKAEVVQPAVAAMEAQRSRDAAIEKAIQDHLTPEKLSFLLEIAEWPIDKEALSDICRKEIYQRNDNAFDEVSRAFAEDLKAAGLLEACPNNGPRKHRAMQAWNTWLAGGDMDEEWYLESSLKRAPLFNALLRCFTSASVEIENEKEKRLFPDLDWKARREVTFDITREDMARIIEQIIDRMRVGLLSESLDSGPTGETSDCQVTGERLHVFGSPFAPVLGSLDKNYRLAAVENLEAPKPARHLELTLRTGEIVVADRLTRHPSIEKGLDALLEEPPAGFNINHGAGKDDEVRAHFEKASVIIVHQTRWTQAFPDGEGLWRVGDVQEDHEAFWENGKPTPGLQPPVAAWETSGPVWSQCFADKADVIDIMMLSGDFDEREKAEAALDEFIEEGEADLVKLDAEKLHLYLPTGSNGKRFTSEVRVPGLDYPEWREDFFLVSTEPLDFPEDKLASCDWVQGDIPTPESFISPENGEDENEEFQL